MTDTYLIAGTASHVGKSTVAAGLCRLLADRGVDVAPFKAQNMSNNARAVPRSPAVRAGRSTTSRNDSSTADRRNGATTGGEPTTSEPHTPSAGTARDALEATRTGTDRASAVDTAADAVEPAFGEIGVSQYTQARAARIRPTTDCNPVLLKPSGDAESQLVIDGRGVADVGAREFYEDGGWERARTAAEAAYRRLAEDHDVIVAEGAGAIAEPNLRDRDLANVETARFADATILLVADLERGGAFASVVGTAELLPDDLRERVGGVLFTKFRGDASLLEPAIDTVEDRLDVPVLGVLPYDDPGLPAEDSVDLPNGAERNRSGDLAPNDDTRRYARGTKNDARRHARGADDGVPPEHSATVAVPRLPRISNFTDLEPLAATPGLRVSYRPLGDDYGDADAVVVPGTKNAVDDLLAAREAGLDDELAAFDGPIVGLCGGYQLLGRRVTNAALEGTGDRDVVEGFDLLPVETRFERPKVVRPSTLRLDGVGPLSDATGTVTGYEIHVGRTRAAESCTTPFAPLSDCPGAETGADGRPGAAMGAAQAHVLGTYLHGLFENDAAREAFASATFDAAGVDPADLECTETAPSSPYDRAAALLTEHADLAPLLADHVPEDGNAPEDDRTT